jgi:hypothetical protein
MDRSWWFSSATNEVHDLHAVAVCQPLLLVPLASDDFAVDLDRDAPPSQTELRDERGNRDALAELDGLSVDDDMHDGTIVSRQQLYNLGCIW